MGARPKACVRQGLTPLLPLVIGQPGGELHAAAVVVVTPGFGSCLAMGRDKGSNPPGSPFWAQQSCLLHGMERMAQACAPCPALSPGSSRTRGESPVSHCCPSSLRARCACRPLLRVGLGPGLARNSRGVVVSCAAAQSGVRRKRGPGVSFTCPMAPAPWHKCGGHAQGADTC